MESRDPKGESAPDQTLSDSSDTAQFVVFELGEERCGFPILQVRSVEKSLPVSRVPQMPNAVEGVVNLRGELVPVIDLRAHFGLPARTQPEYAVVMSRPIEGQMFGLIVDSVSQIAKVLTDDIDDMPSAIASGAQRYVTGAVRTPDGLLVLLDLYHIVSEVEDSSR